MSRVFHARAWQIVILLSFLILTTSCGGGGGGSTDNSGNSTNSTPPPAEPDDSADSDSIGSPVGIRSDIASYYNPIELLQIDIPDNWEIFRFADNPEILVAMADLDTPTLLTGFILVLKVDSLDDADVSDDGEITIISQQNVSLNSLPALEEIGDALIDSENFRIISTAVEYNSSVYAVIYANQVNNYNNYITDYHEARASFKIGEKLLTDLEDFTDYENPGKASIASDGNNFLFVSCRNSTPLSQYDLVGRLIRDDRTITPEFVIHSNLKINGGLGAPKCVYVSPNVIFDGTNYLVTYTSDLSRPAINGKRISPTGIVLDATPVDISQNGATGDVYQAATVFDGTNTFVVWYEERSGGQYIMGAFVEPDMDVSAPIEISDNLEIDFPLPGSDKFTPQVAYGNNRFLVIWAPYFRKGGTLDDDYTIYGQLVGLDGILQTPDRIAIRTDSGTTPRYPQVASDGNEFVVGWIEGAFTSTSSIAENATYEVYARRVSANGTLLNGPANAQGMLIAPVFVPLNNEISKDFLNLTYHDGEYLFLWSSDKNPINTRGIYGVSATGNLGSISDPQRIVGALDSNPILISQFEVPTHSSIAYSDDTALVVWPSWHRWVEGWFFQSEIID